MNKQRRERVEEAIIMLETLKQTVEEIRDEEETTYDNLPESIQESDRGEEMQEYVESLEDACDYLDEALDSLNNI